MIAGGMRGKIGDKEGYVGWWDFLRVFKVPKGVVHSADIRFFCLFANWETWDTDEVSSAATDFIEQ
jgi:hypothetical protein